jgi:hypothetical protein
MLDALKDKKRYIVGPAYDWLFFLTPPLVALALGVWISGSKAANAEVEFWGQREPLSALLIGIIIHAHLAIVFFRSHGNKDIFSTHPARFVLAPIALFAAMMTHDLILVSVSVLATFWDVYHSGAQTFGFARIYDAKAGNPREQGRWLDFWLNQLLYAGPIVGGAVMLDHFEDFREFEDIGVTVFEKVPVWMDGNQSIFAWTLICAGSLFLSYYLYAQYRFHKAGFEVSPQKTFLLVATGFCSIYTWGFNSFGEAFFIMNLFHAVQYFGIVWATEKGSMQKTFRLEGFKWGKYLTLLLFLVLGLGYGYFAQAIDGSVRSLLAITLVCSIMHFWYDGFVWSVRKRQV